MLGLVDPPSSSVRRREGLAVTSTDWWEELAVTSGSSWDELPGAGSCALLYSRGQEVDLR